MFLRSVKVPVLAGITLFLAACGGGSSDSDESPNNPPNNPQNPPNVADNNAPIANAGLDQVANLGSSVTLFGGLSNDVEQSELAYEWSLVSSPAGSSAEIDGSGEVVTFTADTLGSYQIQLVVNDGEFDSETVEVSVEVIESRTLLEDGTSNGQWPNYIGNLSSNNYSPLNQINTDTLDQLEVVWRWAPGSTSGFQFEPTPLFVDNMLYLSTSINEVAALNAETGEELWRFDPNVVASGNPANNGFLHRGVSYDESTGQKIIYMPTSDGRLIALNAISGRPLEEFGIIGNGSVNTLANVPRLNSANQAVSDAHNIGVSPGTQSTQLQISHTSTGTICGDVIVLGSGVHDGELAPPSPPGDVLAFDLETGELAWEFHTVPREGEFGFDTWENESALVNGGANVWAPMSADESLGLVYLPVSGGTNHFYGEFRLGDNLFTDSIVAVDCETGERVWHYQTVHHDIWDYDLPAAPNLIDITVDGEAISALAQVSKQGFVYVLNRVTGEPVWPIPEVAVPGSTVPGEVASPTQPIPSRPPPFVRQGVAADDLINPNSVGTRDVGELYTPITTNGILVTPSIAGGANWGAASYDPTTQILYANGFGPLTSDLQLFPVEFNGVNTLFSFIPFFNSFASSPFPGLGSAVTAYDMNTGEILFQVPGTSNSRLVGNAASMVSGDLLYYKNNGTNVLGVLDKSDGTLLREIPLGGGDVTGVPMTYQLDNRQFIVVAIGNAGQTVELVALALP